jgi:peptidoglycan/LPS O-acetylase OafA/YrhL
MNPVKSHLPFLDGIRGIAIMLVFLVHCMGSAFGFENISLYHGMFRDFHIPRSLIILLPLTYGYLGVPIFFAVSGFCIHFSHVHSGEAGWANFIIRRFFRIYPCYLLSMLVFLILGLAGSMRNIGNVFDLMAHIFSVHNFFRSTFYGINGSYWSIAVEIQLYVLYPLLFLLTSRFGWGRGLLFIGFIELGIRTSDALGLHPPFWLLKSPFAYWLSWGLGAFVAECYVKGRMNIFEKVRFDVMSLILLMTCLLRPLGSFQFPMFSFMTCVAFDRFISGRWNLPITRIWGGIWGHLSFLGKASFGFYLFHQPLLEMALNPLMRFHRLQLFLGRFLPVNTFDFSHSDPLIQLCICLFTYPFILAISYLVYRHLEQPAISFAKGMIKRRETFTISIKAT